DDDVYLRRPPRTERREHRARSDAERPDHGRASLYAAHCGPHPHVRAFPWTRGGHRQRRSAPHRKQGLRLRPVQPAAGRRNPGRCDRLRERARRRGLLPLRRKPRRHRDAMIPRAAFFLTLIVALTGREPALAPKRPALRVPRASTEPVLDGELEEAVWTGS